MQYGWHLESYISSVITLPTVSRALRAGESSGYFDLALHHIQAIGKLLVTTNTTKNRMARHGRVDICRDSLSLNNRDTFIVDK